MWPGPLGATIMHVEIGARLDQIEMDVEAVGEHQRRALFHVGVQMIAIDVALQFVGREHHHHVGPFGGFGHFHDLELFALGLLHALRALAQRHRDVLDAGIAQIERVGMALAAVADDGDLLALDQVQVGVTVVINTHGLSPLLRLRPFRPVVGSVFSAAASMAWEPAGQARGATARAAAAPCPWPCRHCRTVRGRGRSWPGCGSPRRRAPPPG